MLRVCASPLAKHATAARLLFQGSNQARSTTSMDGGASSTPRHDSGSGPGDAPQHFQDLSELLALIACPLTKAPLRYDPQAGKLLCDELGVAYPMLRGVPQLMPLMGEVTKPGGDTDGGGGGATAAGEAAP